MSAGADSVTVTHYVYDPDSVAQAMRDYDAFLAITIVRRDQQETVLRFARPEDGGPAAEQTVSEFLNYLLDLAVRARLSASA